MAITTPVSLSKIIAEFGGPNNLSAYVRGGAYVPNTTANAAISTTAAGLAISQFAGASASSGPLSGNVTPATLSRSRATTGTLSGTVAITASGGSGTYTYSTTRLTGTGAITITGATTATPGIQMSGSPNNEYIGNMRTVISDGTSSINVDWSYDYIFGVA